MVCSRLISWGWLHNHRSTDLTLGKKKNTNFSCENVNVIYLLECQKDNCKHQYIGTTGRQLKHHLADHRGYISSQVLKRAVLEPARPHLGRSCHIKTNYVNN